MYLSLNFTQDPYAHLSPSNTSFTPLHACLFIYLSIHLSSFPSIPRHLLILVSPPSSLSPPAIFLPMEIWNEEEEKRKIGREGLCIYTIDNYNRMEREKRDGKIRVTSGIINRLRCEGYILFLLVLLLCFAHYIFHLASLEDKNTSVEIYSSCRSFRTVCSAAHRPDIGSSASFLAKNFLSSTNYKVLLSKSVKNILSRIFTRSSWKRSSNIISLYTRGVNPSEGLFDSIKSLVIALASFMKSFRFPPSL